MLRMIKKYTEEEIEELKEDIIDKHGDPEKLKQRALRSGCRIPDRVDDYVVLDSLNKGAEYSFEYISRSPNAISSLTPRRVELLSFLSRNDVKSIKELSKLLKRNYKNVYDDIKALEEYGMVSLKRHGKSKKPKLNIDKLVIELG